MKWAADHGGGEARWTQLAIGRPAAVRFWYRTSPRPLLPVSKTSLVSPADPPLQLNGMTMTLLDTKGRLLRFEAAPPQVETPAATPAPRVDWSKLFAAAGLDMSAFTEATPSRTPSTFADERKAWTGTLPDTTIRRPDRSGRAIADVRCSSRWWRRGRRRGASRAAAAAVRGTAIRSTSTCCSAARPWAAWRNVRRGRADKHGAFRLAAFTFFLFVAIWIVSPHVDDMIDEQQRFFTSIGLALFVAGVLYLLYLGLEPFVRRSWPTMLVGWSRMLSGRIRDPLIGRDVLVGVALGAALALLNLATDVLPVRFGLPEPIPHATDLSSLLGARGLVLTVLANINAGLQNALITVFEFAVLRALFEWVTQSGARWGGRRWKWTGRLAMSDETSQRVFIVLCVSIVAILSYAGNGPAGPRLIGAAVEAAAMTLTLIVLLRVGIFASVDHVHRRTPAGADAADARRQRALCSQRLDRHRRDLRAGGGGALDGAIW